MSVRDHQFHADQAAALEALEQKSASLTIPLAHTTISKGFNKERICLLSGSPTGSGFGCARATQLSLKEYGKNGAAVIAGLLFATSAFAAPVAMTPEQLDQVVAGATPINPGGFGLDRAAYIVEIGASVNVVGSQAYYMVQRAGNQR